MDQEEEQDQEQQPQQEQQEEESQEEEEEEEAQEEQQQQQEGDKDPPSDAAAQQPSIETEPAAAPFDPSRMIGVIKRKGLIKELAAAYHAECLAYCQELLELQRKSDEPLIDLKPREDLKKEAMRAPKRLKKTR